MKIYVALVVKALRNFDGILSSTLSLFLMYFFSQGFKSLALFMTKLRVLVRSFPATLNQHPHTGGCCWFTVAIFS